MERLKVSLNLIRQECVARTVRLTSRSIAAGERFSIAELDFLQP
jgi:hypothetical protein